MSEPAAGVEELVGKISQDVRRRAARIEWVVLDVDGVLTDGRLFMDSAGGEARQFHTHDGHGIRLAQKAGLRFALISGRESDVVSRRAGELSIDEVHQGVHRKREYLEEMLGRLGASPAVACYIGDDLIDVPAMRRAGLAVAPSSAPAEVREAAHLVTERSGGHGAVREALEFVLRCQGKWDEVTRPYLEP